MGLTEMGFSFLTRTAFAGMSYGVGSITEEIEHKGNRFKAISVTPLASIENEFVIDGGEQEGKSPEGESIFVQPSWEADQLLTRAFAKKPKKLQATVRRYFDKETLCTSMESP